MLYKSQRFSLAHNVDSTVSADIEIIHADGAPPAIAFRVGGSGLLFDAQHLPDIARVLRAVAAALDEAACP